MACNIYEGKLCGHPSTTSQGLAQCPTPDRYSLSGFGMNEWKNYFHILLLYYNSTTLNNCGVFRLGQRIHFRMLLNTRILTASDDQSKLSKTFRSKSFLGANPNRSMNLNSDSLVYGKCVNTTKFGKSINLVDCFNFNLFNKYSICGLLSY